ncbi:MAG: hypothetical protein UX80_C0004G0012 [Candidatus Amesbacteria bacterium GW2011_GWA2_47_11b]|uniref:Uncharacterized protein n=3 Tax=Candidatus Amesiibacteriota TaxID=1752730 RepID=A0A0G1US91_9BACT|nr:MAG: hypothetical protein UX42_C0012G0016 [Microgenomates group bacterium GW2011_GWC1_46_20]KKU58261.1 MAG: hypothetical protein UX80_C0004G0012 [Candidatus Amesbacteria bacterium GW2011_GWA2_47_11b]KKU68898.1 MAG: hypothetical protein UX92_C0017G0005 [Candidatus Amesbacteria bacterium GW2011_GWA1_47_20]KKU84775.1 MAG: hypothetical protein UY11_C0004G0017 [Candidatus Amesbacteria bacterium GW2011_GWC2_47_8]
MSKNIREQFKLLSLGEKLRENPKTIWLSVPAFLFSALWSTLVGNREELAGSFGHLGISWELIRKHHWKSGVFLDLALWSYQQAVKIGVGDGQPSVRLKIGSMYAEKGDLPRAKKYIEEGLALCRNIKDVPQGAFLLAHLGRIKTKLGDFAGAKKDLDKSLSIMEKILKKDSSLRLHIWASTAEMGLAEWYLAAGDKKRAKLWAQKVATRATIHDLKTRALDAKDLLAKISAATTMFMAVIQTAWYLAFRR